MQLFNPYSLLSCKVNSIGDFITPLIPIQIFHEMSKTGMLYSNQIDYLSVTFISRIAFLIILDTL